MGVGMAMLEATEYDQRTGAPINSNLADYIVAVNADCPHIDVTFLDYPDFKLNPIGARGVGEIGLAGAAAAITNAVYHATGVRVRRLPVRIEDLLMRLSRPSVLIKRRIMARIGSVALVHHAFRFGQRISVRANIGRTPPS